MNSLLYLFIFSTCFLVSTVGREAIIGGNHAKDNQFPYHVAISISNMTPNCGGGIIGDKHILTAASCVIGPNDQLYGKPILVIAGTTDYKRPGIVVDVDKVFISKSYLPRISIIYFDIAVLQLKRPLGLRTNNCQLKKLIIPSHHQSFIDKTTILTGYGWTWVHVKDNQQTGGYNDTHLRFAEARVISSEQCDRDHPSLKTSETYSKRSLCAKITQYNQSSPRGACIGDGGGPLVARGIAVVGIFVLSKIGCSERNNSGFYIRVSHYRAFIENSIENRITTYMRTLDVNNVHRSIIPRERNQKKGHP